MNAFLDSSSVIKLYYPEADSDEIERYVDENINEIYLSELAILEFRSALWRKVRIKEIIEKIAAEAISCFNSDSPNFKWIQLNQIQVQSARNLLMKFGAKGLRTLDSIQFAAALSVKSPNTVFFTADNLLKSFFEEEDLKTF